jgi:hypothetical protein
VPAPLPPRVLVVAALRGAAPGTSLVLQSGRIGPDELAGFAAEFRAVGVLEKPFGVAELLAAVRQAVGLT